MGSQEANTAPHVLIFPLPIQGHVNTMLRLAELLCLAGLHVTFVVSDFCHARLLQHSTVASRFARYSGFRLQTISDGLPDDHPRAGEGFGDIVPSMKKATASLFNQMMVESNCFSSSTRRPISCIILDGFLSFVADFAEENGIALIYFRTISACSFWAGFCIPQVIEAVELPIRGQCMDLMVKSIPGMGGFLRRRDLPGYFRVNDVNEAGFQVLKQETRQTPRAQALILNTFEDLEGQILSQIRKHIPRVYTIGPNHSLLHARETSLGVSASFWEEDRSCLAWLDSQPEKSVLYVSLGSIAVVTRVQTLEFWYGLVNSGQRFLWVMRPDSVMGKETAESRLIPAELEDGTKARGYMVGWAPQQEVLNHPAIGGFLTHGGWNSILESIVAGVPMICWPYMADQMINSRFVEEIWKIGLDMKDTCDRIVIEKMVRELMELRKDEFLERVDGVAILARKAVNVGGSSYCNSEALVQFIKSTMVVV